MAPRLGIVVSQPEERDEESPAQRKKGIRRLEIVGGGARLNLRLPKTFRDHLLGEAKSRRVSANLLVYGTLYREFPMTVEPAVGDLERAIRDFDAGDARRDAVIGLAEALRGKPWYLSGTVVRFLEDLSPGKPDRLHVQVILLRRAFREGAQSPRFTTGTLDPDNAKEPTIAIRLLQGLERSGVLTARTVSAGDRRIALSALMWARRETGDLLPGVVACLIQCVVRWEDEDPRLLEEPFRCFLLRPDWETILSRLQALTRAKGDVADPVKQRARRMMRVLRSLPPAAVLATSR
jgi:hypothetical protein